MPLCFGLISKWYYTNSQSKFYTISFFAIFLRSIKTQPSSADYFGARFSIYLNDKTNEALTKHIKIRFNSESKKAAAG